jgi:hypothetical protein
VKAPQSDERLLIIGKTGSGKTQAGLFHLSRADFHRRPWVIFDYKLEKFFSKLEITELKLSDRAPTKPGLYVVRPLPHQYEEVKAFVWRLWQKERIGLFFDEATMLFEQGKINDAVKACLTQGRSKLMQVIACTQRPAWIDRSFYTETEKFQIFYLSQDVDVKSVQANVPGYDPDALEEYQSWWHEVAGKASKTVLMSPVPPPAKILATFRRRARKKRAVL